MSALPDEVMTAVETIRAWLIANPGVANYNRVAEAWKRRVKSKAPGSGSGGDLMLQPRGCLTVSDHAVVRYLERVEGLDVEDLHAIILPPEVREVILHDPMRRGKALVPGSHVVAFRDRHIVTVTKPNWMEVAR